MLQEESGFSGESERGCQMWSIKIWAPKNLNPAANIELLVGKFFLLLFIFAYTSLRTEQDPTTTKSMTPVLHRASWADTTRQRNGGARTTATGGARATESGKARTTTRRGTGSTTREGSRVNAPRGHAVRRHNALRVLLKAVLGEGA